MAGNGTASAFGHEAEYRRCLEELDIAGVQKLWRHTDPHLEHLGDDDTLTALHYARTAAATVRFKLRAYSHAWLTERCLPSGLPDYLKPRAQRIYPVIVKSVGVATGRMPGKPRDALSNAVMSVMLNAVSETHADGHALDDPIIKQRMLEARAKFLKGA